MSKRWDRDENKRMGLAEYRGRSETAFTGSSRYNVEHIGAGWGGPPCPLPPAGWVWLYPDAPFTLQTDPVV